jgi:putative oxidoreductase
MAPAYERKFSGFNDIVLLAGRILIAVLFLIAAYLKFKGLGGTTGYFTKLGVPASSVVAPLVATFELAVGCCCWPASTPAAPRSRPRLSS